MSSTTDRSPHQKKFYIPQVNIEPFLKDPDSATSKTIIEEVRAACRSTGFFEITGHGIPKSLQKEVFGAASQFFKLSFDEKKRLDASKQIGYRGYDMLASQAYGKDLLPDLKEGFYIGIDIPKTDPRAGRFFTGPNVWPDESLLPASQFKDPCTMYFSAMLQLSFRIMALLARTLPYGPHIFDEFIANDPAAPLRLLHYPPPPMASVGPEQQKKQFGASAHTDFGAITILLQDENPGLEVLDQDADSWVPIDPNPGAYVVNVGDMLSLWTSGEYKSSVHRVISKNPTDRYSVVFFLDGNLDCSLNPLDGSENRGPKTVEEHMTRRLTASYGVEKEKD
ncbi:2OG-Fe(II) oxygenase family oxidoreductase, putative [Paecilomyces variotii No. 5]|uniref:2OG-Fe(II) oxygenase family oxidoreductase, putative n=1 Tax=Byssochlamys spectabilis (strain No. 5 / NBRC 109023) TaxID=1356009 RepID=V5FKX9_BYSSN|nr:2OG-Fe(II) oxygenase family oxidoreductase, putative [Paecilomyces variotii No. 5]